MGCVFCSGSKCPSVENSRLCMLAPDNALDKHASTASGKCIAGKITVNIDCTTLSTQSYIPDKRTAKKHLLEKTKN